MVSNNWPFFAPNQQQTIAPVVLVPQQTTSTSVNSYDVNNLIMYSQQKAESLMTSDELHRKVDQQIKQHWFLLDERQPPPSSPRPPSTSLLTTMPPSHLPNHHHHDHGHHHHHQHSYSTNSSPNQSVTRKKNVCFNDTSTIRRYSVDDLDISRPSTSLKSCLKSSLSSLLTTNDEKNSSINVSHHVQTQTLPRSQKPRPHSAVVSSNVYRTSAVSQPIEHWHARQLKSAPGKKSYILFLDSS